jgi:hypothetical protein
MAEKVPTHTTMNEESIHSHTPPNMPSPEGMTKVNTADSVWIPRDVFEKLYLNPERAVAGDLRKKVCMLILLSPHL